MKIPNPIPFHEIPLSTIETNVKSIGTAESVLNPNTKLIATLLVSFAILAAGSYIYYEIKKNKKKKSEQLT